MKFILFTSIFLILVILILYNINVFSKFEYMNNFFYYDFYLKNFNRLPDPIIKNYFANLNDKLILAQLNIYYEQVKKGENFVSNKKIIIAGLIRNAEKNIYFLKKIYEKIKKICLETVFIIVENDSKDNTRKYLLEWNKIDPSVIILCDNNMINTNKCNIIGFEYFYDEKIPFVHRIKKLSYLRNIYLNFIKNSIKLKNFDFMFVMDLDLNGKLHNDGILQSFYHFSKDLQISAICCNGLVKNSNNKLTYYDSFAYVQLGEDYEWNNDFDKFSHDEDVLQNITKKYIKDLNLDKVKSAFGGFSIYNLNHIIETNASYNYSKNNKLSCEHAHFNILLKNIYVNPRMIFEINYI